MTVNSSANSVILILFAFSDNLSAENSKLSAESWHRGHHLLGCMIKTPSNPKFSPFGPIKCREKTLINTKFLNSKVCFGGPRSYWKTKLYDL